MLAILVLLAIVFGVMVWIALAMIAGLVAMGKGRSLFGFLLLGLALPIIGLIVAFLVPPTQASLDARALQNGTLKRCPACAESVKAEAIVCRHCGTDLRPAGVARLMPLPPKEKQG